MRKPHWGRLFAPVLLSVAALMGVGVPLASAAAPPPPTAVTAVPAWAPPVLNCASSNFDSRFKSCQNFKGAVTVYLNYRPIGTLGYIGALLQDTTRIDDHTYQGSVTFTGTYEVGTDVGTTILTSGACYGGSGCSLEFTGSSSFFLMAGKSSAVYFRVHYKDVNPTYHTLQFKFAPEGSTSLVTLTSKPIRCDNVIGGRSAGCINPLVIPVFKGMANAAMFPVTGANIRTQQAKSVHYGRPGSAPLHWDPAWESANRAAMVKYCPKITQTKTDRISCDESPPAQAREGAARSCPSACNVVRASLSEQSRQGAGYRNNRGYFRVVTGDAFYIDPSPFSVYPWGG